MAVIAAGVVAGSLSGMMVYAQITIASRSEQVRTRTIEGSPGGRPLTVVALGDSVVWGLGCECDGYVHAVAEHITEVTGRPSVVHNEAIVAGGSQDMLDRMTEAHVKEHIRGAELVIVQIGANDFAEDDQYLMDENCSPSTNRSCFERTIETMEANITRIVRQVKSLQHAPRSQIVLMGYWNVAADGAAGRENGETFVKNSDQLTRWTNDVTRKVARAEGLIYADAYTPFKGEDGKRDVTDLLADDGEHPLAAGHQLLAGAVLVALGERKVSVTGA